MGQVVEEHRLTGAQGTFHLRVWPVESPSAVVLFLHGLGEYGGLYGPLAERLAQDGIELWAPDQIGHGLGDGPRVLVRSLAALADDAELVLGRIAAERPGVPLVLGGHSLGSAVTLLLAGGRASAAAAMGLVLAGASIGLAPDDGRGDVKPGLRQMLDELGIDPMDLRKDPSELCANPVYAEQIRRDPLVWDGGLRPETLDALETGGAEIARLLAAGAVALPVLFLHGGADDLAPPGTVLAAAERLPDARVRVFPGDRHNLFGEADRAAVYDAFAAFVLKVVRPGSAAA